MGVSGNPVHMVPYAEVEQVLSSSRAAREEIAIMRRRTQEARLAVHWQRVRARKQLGQLEQALDQLRVTLAQGPQRLEWARPDGALDNVLYPVD